MSAKGVQVDIAPYVPDMHHLVLATASLRGEAQCDFSEHLMNGLLKHVCQLHLVEVHIELIG